MGFSAVFHSTERGILSAAAASGIAARSIGPFFAAAYAVGRLIACCLPLVALETISLAVCDLLPSFVGTPTKGVTGLGPKALVSPVAILKAFIPIRDPSSMRRIMVPVVVADLGSVEVVVSVDIDVDVGAMPVAIAPHRGPYGQPYAERDGRPRVDISWWVPVVGLVHGVCPGA